MTALPVPIKDAEYTGRARRWRRVAVFGPAAGLALSLLGVPAVMAQSASTTRLNAHYAITMIGVPIGQIAWTIDIGDGNYLESAFGKASGALSMLVNGEGRAAVRGVIENMTPQPAAFTSNVTDDDGVAGLEMTFENGSVKTLRIDQPPKDDGRRLVTEDDRKGVSDPLSAMLIAPAPGGNNDSTILTPHACERTLPIFDGQRRYDLFLSFKRMDNVKVARGYAGPALVCGLMMKPIAGYRTDSMLVKYVGGQRNLELWFAPISGTAYAAPVRLLIPTMIGTLEISADRFETAGGAPAPAPANVSEPQR